MKKLFLYASILVATMAFTACTEDYTDWADPQAYAQEDPAAAYGLNITEGSQSNFVMAEAPEQVELVAVSSDNENISNLILNSVTVYGEKVPATLENGVIKVDAFYLDSLVEVKTLDRSSTPHAFDVVVDVAAKLLYLCSDWCIIDCVDTVAGAIITRMLLVIYKGAEAS